MVGTASIRPFLMGAQHEQREPDRFTSACWALPPKNPCPMECIMGRESQKDLPLQPDLATRIHLPRGWENRARQIRHCLPDTTTRSSFCTGILHGERQKDRCTIACWVLPSLCPFPEWSAHAEGTSISSSAYR